MKTFSLGSNCEMHLMIDNHVKKYIPEAIISSNIFGWANVKINLINDILKNPGVLTSQNFSRIYRLFSKTGSNISKGNWGYHDFSELLCAIKEKDGVESVHVDIYFSYEELNFWLHGIVIPINEFVKDNEEYYANTIKSKTEHLRENFLNALRSEEPQLFCIKCLKGEYSLQNIIDFNNLLLKYSSKNFMAIIAEESENISMKNLNLKNTSIVVAPKLTYHSEAVYSHLYNTEIYYKELFEKIKSIL
jgi:hypothetical protein